MKKMGQAKLAQMGQFYVAVYKMGKATIAALQKAVKGQSPHPL